MEHSGVQPRARVCNCMLCCVATYSSMQPRDVPSWSVPLMYASGESCNLPGSLQYSKYLHTQQLASFQGWQGACSSGGYDTQHTPHNTRTKHSDQVAASAASGEGARGRAPCYSSSRQVVRYRTRGFGCAADHNPC